MEVVGLLEERLHVLGVELRGLDAEGVLSDLPFNVLSRLLGDTSEFVEVGDDFLDFADRLLRPIDGELVYAKFLFSLL